MYDNLDLPIALRRTPRHRTSTTALQPPRLPRLPPASLVTKTPSKSRTKKRVRFSDPGLDPHHYSPSSTGLTPMIKRSSLEEPSPKRRRHSTPAISRRSDEEGRRTRSHGLDTETLPVQVKPKKSVKGGAGTRTRRVQKAVEVAAAQAEIERLRLELAGRDAEIERLQNTTLIQDTERIVQLEEQIDTLRRELAQQQESVEDDALSGIDQDESSFYDWTLAARDPFSDDFLDGADEGSGDTTMGDVACSTPSRRQKIITSTSASASFPTPPCTSPTAPATPCSMRIAITPVTPQSSHIGTQTAIPDMEKEALRNEMGSLRLELTKLADALDSHVALQSRLTDKLSNVEERKPQNIDSDDITPGLEKHLDLVLQTLSDRTAALSELSLSITSLGFPGSDASDMIASIASGFRTARLELEYLTPGEITLPLSHHGAEVLDLVLTRLRDMARKSHEDDEAIDEYHALELSLRQQLGARVDCMDDMNKQLKSNDTAIRERDERIAELEIGLDRLKGAADGYRRDISELESLIQRLETDSKEGEASLQIRIDCMQAELSQKTADITDLETKLAATLTETEELRTQQRELRRRKEAETKVRNKSNGAALALRDARVAELRREIYGINDSLRRAHEIIRKLRVENAGLERRVDEEQRSAREAVHALKAELERATAAAATSTRRRTRSSSATTDKSTPATPEPGSFLSGDLARSGAGRSKKRKYDSGLGFLDEEEDDLELV
ncbi:hypothetical protein F5Y16DRAFT_174005 [Xylariaceae sp. FL0255]|nr:hypothetical protein F5Y16DRAFT_174005 [Xylariaceae sp. FL0255]